MLIAAASVTILIALALVFLAILNRVGSRKDSFSAPNLIDARFAELSTLEKKYNRIMKWTRRAGNLLSFTQYVIGVVVASSYFQGASSKELIGFLGLSVVVATAIQQRYRPEVRSRKGEKAVARIRALKREAQDKLAQQLPHAHVLQLLTHGINRIERDESIDPDVQLSPSPDSSARAHLPAAHTNESPIDNMSVEHS